MPEDEGQNGDRWTDHASALMVRLGWEKVADSNIDIEGTDGLKHGIDAMFRYEDGFNRPMQGVFLEAKRYATTSFRPAKLSDWVSRFDEKMLHLRTAAEFNEHYPAMSETKPNNGILVLWFHDLDEHPAFRPKLQEHLAAIRTMGRRSGSREPNRLFVMENERILRLCSLVDAADRINNSAPPGQPLRFYYPSSLDLRHPSQERTVLNLEYMWSKFVLAKATVDDRRMPTVEDVVFYFGHLDMSSFHRLKQALLRFEMLHTDRRLHLFLYERSDEFRKIQPDVVKLFSEDRQDTVRIDPMNVHRDLPPWILNP